jgi:hypothetical protein
LGCISQWPAFALLLLSFQRVMHERLLQSLYLWFAAAAAAAASSEAFSRTKA